MAASVGKCFLTGNFLKKELPLCITVRYRRWLIGKPPGIARSLEQRLEELSYKDPELHFRVNIGLPKLKVSRSGELKERLEHLKKQRSNPQLEKLARTKQLSIPLHEVKEDWKRTGGPFQIKEVADHYGIFEDLFGEAYFVPRVMLDIGYAHNDALIPVHRGNVIKPHEAAVEPEVQYDADSNTLWTLILSNPDGHFTEKDSEYVHWFVGNIPGNDLKKGEVVWNYLQPFPPRGTGFHRFIYILYKQDRKIDYSALKKKPPCLRLKERSFKTLDFYRQHQDVLTPAGLAFFQSNWDSTLTDFFHNVLKMREPVFEFDFPEEYHPPQKWYPLRQPFNLYLDRYRDQKQIAKEMLLKKLKNVHPFERPETRFKYPNAHYMDAKLPTWVKTELKKERLKIGRYKDF